MAYMELWFINPGGRRFKALNQHKRLPFTPEKVIMHRFCVPDSGPRSRQYWRG